MNRMLLSVGALLGAAMPLVFDSALKGAALLLLAAICALGMKRASASARHLVWLVAVVALLVVPVLSGYLPQWRVLPGWAVAPALHEEELLAAPLPAPATGTLREAAKERVTESTARVSEREPQAPMAEAVKSVGVPQPIETPAAVPAVSRSWRAWLPLVWIAGFALCCVRLLVAYVALRRVEGDCEEVANGPLAEALAEAQKQLGVRQRVRLLVDRRRTIPVVWGVFRPRLMLPLEAASWPERQLRSVLLHELAHIRRRDTAVQWLTQIVCALYWFNPLVWLAAWRLHAERERACDDLVLASGVRASEYAEHLLHVATRLQGAGWMNACGLAMARPSRLEGRLLAVLSERLNRRRVTAAIVVVALVLGAGIAIPLSMLRAAQEVEAWNPPQAAQVSSNTRSSYCVHDGTQAAFVLFHAGMSGSHTESSNNPKTRTWTDAGEVELENGKTFSFLRSHTAPEALTLNGEVLELAKGRVFLLGSDGTYRQVAMNPPAIRDQAALEQFDLRLKTVLAAIPPQENEALTPSSEVPSLLAAQAGEQRLRVEVSKGMGALVFKVGEAKEGQAFELFLVGEKPQSFVLDFEPGVESMWKRLRISHEDYVPSKLPTLPPFWMPDGNWVWRKEVEWKDGRVTFADVVAPDGSKLPVTVEAMGKDHPRNRPSVTSAVQVECSFRIYGMKDGAPSGLLKVNQAELKQWETRMGKALNDPKVTTKSGNRAVIEIIREYRHQIDGEWETDNLGTSYEIEPQALKDGVRLTGQVRLGFIEAKYESLQAALEPLTDKSKLRPQGGNFKQLRADMAGDLKAGEALLIPLSPQGLFPETAVAVVTMEAKPLMPWPSWETEESRAGKKVNIDGWALTVPAEAIPNFRKTLQQGSYFPGGEVFLDSSKSGERRYAVLNEKQFAALQGLATERVITLEAKRRVVATANEAARVQMPNGNFDIKATVVQSAVELDITPEVVAGALPTAHREHTVLTTTADGPVLMWDVPKAGEPAQAVILCAAPQEALPPGPTGPVHVGVLPARLVQAVTMTNDSAQIAVDRGVGSLAWMVGEGAETRMIVHAFGASGLPIVFRVSADDRQGQWWDEVKITREGEGTSLFPLLPRDWLPHGRVVFAPQASKQADGSYLIAEIESASGRVPIRVRLATPAETERGSLREIPRTFAELEIVLDARVHALAKPGPGKATLLPVMAAEDLVGTPRGAVAHPYQVLKPGLPGTFNRGSTLAEGMEVTANLDGASVHISGEIQVGLGELSYPSAVQAWKQMNQELGSKSPVKILQAPIDATLGGNEALVVPIPTQGAFPETLVVSMTALPRRVVRPSWLPPSARPPIEIDGWVLTWPAAEREWFTKLFDYDGLPSMIQHIVEKRKDVRKNVYWSESVGTLQQAEVEQLIAQFRQHAGVSVQRVEPFKVKQHLSPMSSPQDRVSFAAAGEPATVLIRTDEKTISPDLTWTRPVIPQISGSSGYAIYSGTSLCALLPGPADPAEIRMLVLRCVDPSKGGPAPKTVPKPKADAPIQQAEPESKKEAKVRDAKAPMVVTQPGKWELGEGVTLEITSQLVHAADQSTTAILHWPAKGGRPEARHEIHVAADAFGNRDQWAVGWVPGKPAMWVVSEGPATGSSIRQLVFEKPEQIFENYLGRRKEEPFHGLDMPKEMAGEFDRIFETKRRDPAKIELPGGPLVGGQQQSAAKSEEQWSVEGTVTDAEGQPAVGVVVQVTCEHYPLVLLDVAKTDAAGKYHLSFRLGLETLAAFRGVEVRPVQDGFVERGLAKTGEFNAVLQSGENVARPFADQELVIGQMARADFVMQSAAVIEGQIVDLEGKPLAKRFIAARTPGQRLGYSIASTTTDMEGRFRLTGIPSNFPVSLHTAEFEKPQQNGESEPQTYEAGKTQLVHVTVRQETSDREKVTVQMAMLPEVIGPGERGKMDTALVVMEREGDPRKITYPLLAGAKLSTVSTSALLNSKNLKYEPMDLERVRVSGMRRGRKFDRIIDVAAIVAGTDAELVLEAGDIVTLKAKKDVDGGEKEETTKAPAPGAENDLRGRPPVTGEVAPAKEEQQMERLLSVRVVAGSTAQGAVPLELEIPGHAVERIFVEPEPILTARDFRWIRVEPVSGGKFTVSVELSGEGLKRHSQQCEKYLGREKVWVVEGRGRTREKIGYAHPGGGFGVDLPIDRAGAEQLQKQFDALTGKRKHPVDELAPLPPAEWEAAAKEPAAQGYLSLVLDHQFSSGWVPVTGMHFLAEPLGALGSKPEFSSKLAVVQSLRREMETRGYWKPREMAAFLDKVANVAPEILGLAAGKESFDRVKYGEPKRPAPPVAEQN